jgi:ATP-dependent Clp protease ATP-binding subunit ClpA
MKPLWPLSSLSHRYITDRFLPDKAIDLIDEAAARIRLEIDSVPEEIDDLDTQYPSAGDRKGSLQAGAG